MFPRDKQPWIACGVLGVALGAFAASAAYGPRVRDLSEARAAAAVRAEKAEAAADDAQARVEQSRLYMRGMAHRDAVAQKQINYLLDHAMQGGRQRWYPEISRIAHEMVKTDWGKD